MTQRQIEHLPIGALRPWPKNSRTHSRKQVRQIADSIRRFGFTNPVLIDSDNMILAGHARVCARRDRAGSLRWQRLDRDRRPQDQPARLCMRARPCLLRPHHPPVGDLCKGRGRAGRLRDRHHPGRTRESCMTTEKDRQRALAARPGTQPYEVGYAKPPAHSRFRPGSSGNPRGRPRGSKNRPRLPALNEERLKTIVLEEAYRTVNVNDASGPISLPMAQAVMRSLAVNAAKGNQRAQRLFAELLSSVERDNKRLHDEWFATAIDYKIEWERELERRKKLGIEAPDPIPHPDHLVIDMKAGTVRIKGPMTKEEKAAWDHLRERKQECDREIAELEDLLKRSAMAPLANLSLTRSNTRRSKKDDFEGNPRLTMVGSTWLRKTFPASAGRIIPLGHDAAAPHSRSQAASAIRSCWSAVRICGLNRCLRPSTTRP